MVSTSIKELLQQQRLLICVGAGGVGKNIHGRNIRITGRFDGRMYWF